VPENDSLPRFPGVRFISPSIKPRGASSRATARHRSGAAPGSGSQMMSWRRDEQTRDARSEGLRREPGCAWVASSAAICRDLQRADPQDQRKG
jgi:hypothetical protein